MNKKSKTPNKGKISPVRAGCLIALVILAGGLLSACGVLGAGIHVPGC